MTPDLLDSKNNQGIRIREKKNHILSSLIIYLVIIVYKKYRLIRIKFLNLATLGSRKLRNWWVPCRKENQVSSKYDIKSMLGITRHLHVSLTC